MRLAVVFSFQNTKLWEEVIGVSPRDTTGVAAGGQFLMLAAPLRPGWTSSPNFWGF